MGIHRALRLAELELALRRLGTNSNVFYKSYYRRLLTAYRLGGKPLLQNLRGRLLGSWKASPPLVVPFPKKSGLHRPFRLLDIEDQIVLQAIAGEFARLLRRRRERVEYKVVFSYVLNDDDDSVFLTRDWKKSYRRRLSRIRSLLRRGLKWTVVMDLSEYFETIDHRRLLSLATRTSGDMAAWLPVVEWLRVWGPGGASNGPSHGIPQGPDSSSFLGEAFLLPLDEEMLRKKRPFLRYVDDMILLSTTRDGAVEMAASLESSIRALGLLPQSSKFDIFKAKNAEEIAAELGGYSGYYGEQVPPSKKLSARRTVRTFLEGIRRRPLGVIDKTKFRRAMFSGSAEPSVLRLALALVAKHPEHVDAIHAYLSRNYRANVLIVRSISSRLRSEETRPALRGQLWDLLLQNLDPSKYRHFISLARHDLNRFNDFPSVQWSAGRFLMECAKRRRVRSMGFFFRAHPIIQANLVQHLPDREFSAKGAVAKILRSSAFAPISCIAPELVERRLDLRTLKVHLRELPPQARLIYKAAGLVAGSREATPDPIATILSERFNVKERPRWRALLRKNYRHSLSTLKVAESSFELAPSTWLSCMNSFMHATLLAFNELLHRRGSPAYQVRTDRSGAQKKYGSMIQSGAPFDRSYPKLASALRSINRRRNKLPDEHPFDDRTLEPNRRLSPKERIEYYKFAREAILEFQAAM